MLSKLRDFSKSKLAGVLIAIIIIPFVFWGMGSVFSSGNTNNVAKINNDNISTKDFINFINESRIDPENLRKNLDKNILEEILSQIISLKLLKMEMKDIGIVLSDEVLLNKIVNDTNFIDNNNFSRIKYEKFLIENNISASEYENKLKNSEQQIDLYQYINGGVVSPNFMTKNNFIENTKSINIEYVYLENLYKSEFTEKELQKYINENSENMKVDTIDVKFTKIKPDNLTNSNEFSKIFFEKLDSIENDILNDLSIEDLSQKYGLILLEEKGYVNELKEDSLLSNIYENRKNNKIQIIDKEDYYILYEIKKIKSIIPNLDEKNFRDKVIKILRNKEKFNFNKNILEKIENKSFSDDQFNKIAGSKENIKKYLINSKDDNKLFNIDSLNLLYTIPENDFLLIVDNEKNVYLTKIINFEYKKFENDLNVMNKFSMESEVLLKNNISKSYDEYINSKYKVNINANTLDRLKNYFK